MTSLQGVQIDSSTDGMEDSKISCAAGRYGLSATSRGWSLVSPGNTRVLLHPGVCVE